MRSIATSPDIQVDGVVIRRPARGEGARSTTRSSPRAGTTSTSSATCRPSILTPHQHKLLADAVKKGAGLMMLGGRSSFGAGGWADTDLADILPAEIHPGDGQLEPEGGVKFVPSTTGLDSYILQVGANKAETARIWDMMPPILGTNRFGEPKKGAEILARPAGRAPSR